MELAIYEDIKGLVSALVEAGADETAQRLDDVVAAGATGGEILMGVRWILGRALEAGEIPSGLTASAERIRAEAAALLR